MVGAGPGSPGLLTLDALAALIQADVLVHDALVDPRVLALARSDAELRFAGKRGGRPSMAQADISAQLIDLAQRGLRVLRLKGGDPFVFGRGGEEILALAAAGVPFRIIPGVTSGLVALASARIPATMRGINQAIILATGHGAEDEDGVDWTALARTRQPIVLYMGLRNLESIAHAAHARRTARRHPSRRDLIGNPGGGASVGVQSRTHRRRRPGGAIRSPGHRGHRRCGSHPSTAAGCGRTIRELRMRKLKLIGIGAGNPDYITLQAVNALKQVDVVFLTDKGTETADLLRARTEVCRRHMQSKPYRIVDLPDPERERTGGAYPPAVAAWHEQRADLYEQIIREQLPDGECGAFLVWGDPSLYDSTLRIIDQVAARRTVDFECEIIPGITSIQALAARHRISLNQIGEPVHVTTGRRLAETNSTAGTNVVVLLDGQCAFKPLAHEDVDIYWGAYLGTPDEILLVRQAQRTLRSR